MTVDDAVMRELKKTAAARGLSLKEVVNRALRAALQALDGSPPRRKRYRVRAFRMGQPHIGLDRALAVAAELETEEILRKQALRK